MSKSNYGPFGPPKEPKTRSPIVGYTGSGNEVIGMGKPTEPDPDMQTAINRARATHYLAVAEREYLEAFGWVRVFEDKTDDSPSGELWALPPSDVVYNRETALETQKAVRR